MTSATNSNSEIEELPGMEIGVSRESKAFLAFAEADSLIEPKAILLVEDQAFVREAAAEALGSAGYRMLVARNATEALELCRNCSPPIDLLLTDVIMPGPSGRELAEQFSGFYPLGRVLLMSGYADELPLPELTSGRAPQLKKPFSVETLLRSVREILESDPLPSGVPAKPESAVLAFDPPKIC